MSGTRQCAPLRTLTKRREFLAAARAKRCAAPGLVVQMVTRLGDDLDPRSVGIGFTASRKVGNAVARNRAKRRMRALAVEMMPERGRPGHDYVLIARQALLTRSFDGLRRDLASCLERVVDARVGGARVGGRRRGDGRARNGR